MTAEQCAIRQAERENLFSCGVRPETVRDVEAALNRIRALDIDALCKGDLDAFRELGAVRWAAFAALTQMQADQKVFKEFGAQS